MKMSSLVSSLVINPYPLFTLNHFTLPDTWWATEISVLDQVVIYSYYL